MRAQQGDHHHSPPPCCRSVAEIPTLAGLSMVLMGLLLLGAGLFALRIG